MKISIYYSLLNFQYTKRFKQFFFVFALLVLGVFSQNVSAQTVSVENDQDGVEGSLVNGRFEVVVAPFFDGDVVVNYTVLPSSTAISGTDFSPLSGTVTVNSDFFIGGSSTVFVFSIDDTLVEGNETVTIKLSPSNDYNIDAANDEATVVIADDDVATLTIDDASAEEGNNINFTVRSDKVVQYDYVLDINFADIDAEGGALPFNGTEDYNNGTQSITFVSGSLAQNFNVQTNNDNLIENDETFTVNLKADNDAVDDTDTAVGTILNNDVAQVTVLANRPSTNEDGSGNNGRFRIELNEQNDTGGTLTVDYTISGTATEGDDFT
ncbi:Calx-beta domain-containing protein, partial [Maribacter dokdonensis]|uniref:Calx-beta domain-containing protein n=1 Tax=Maribacter dokdonensis TaxID=320912 RepID=UPI00329A7F43